METEDYLEMDDDNNLSELKEKARLVCGFQ